MFARRRFRPPTPVRFVYGLEKGQKALFLLARAYTRLRLRPTRNDSGSVCGEQLDNGDTQPAHRSISPELQSSEFRGHTRRAKYRSGSVLTAARCHLERDTCPRGLRAVVCRFPLQLHRDERKSLDYIPGRPTTRLQNASGARVSPSGRGENPRSGGCLPNVYHNIPKNQPNPKRFEYRTIGFNRTFQGH
jgi:hypothetical protein